MRALYIKLSECNFVKLFAEVICAEVRIVIHSLLINLICKRINLRKRSLVVVTFEFSAFIQIR